MFGWMKRKTYQQCRIEEYSEAARVYRENAANLRLAAEAAHERGAHEHAESLIASAKAETNQAVSYENAAFDARYGIYLPTYDW